jgi:hypothetical protein
LVAVRRHTITAPALIGTKRDFVVGVASFEQRAAASSRNRMISSNMDASGAGKAGPLSIHVYAIGVKFRF